jgi:hypothetical protein
MGPEGRPDGFKIAIYNKIVESASQPIAAFIVSSLGTRTGLLGSRLVTQTTF